MRINYNSQKGEKLIIKEKGKIHQVQIEEITHITCESTICTIKTISHNIIVYRPLKTFEQELSAYQFFRVNRNTLVNFKHLINYSSNGKTTIKIKPDIIIPISKGKIKDLLKKLHESNFA